MKLEFKLYYDVNGKVITYTTENLPNQNFIIITKEQFAEARPDVLVIDEKLIYQNSKRQVCKLEISDSGTKTSKYDINILTDDDENFVYWKIVVNDVT